MVVTVEPMRDEEFTQSSIKGFISRLRKLYGRFLEGRFAQQPAPPDARAVVRAMLLKSADDGHPNDVLSVARKQEVG